MIKRTFSGRSIIILVIIAAIASSMAILSYEFSSFTSGEIAAIASRDIKNSSALEAYHLSRILVNKMASISTNLQVISSDPRVTDKHEYEAHSIFDRAQGSTKDITDFYMWLDENGKILWVSNINQTTFDQVYHQDLSYRQYFTAIQKNVTGPYYSSAIDSNDEIPRIYISYPIIDNGSLKGVVVAGVMLTTLGEFLQNEIPPEIQSTVGLIDKNGIVLYSQNQTLIGTNIFGDKFQRLLPSEIKDSFNGLLRRSIEGGAGAEDISYNGTTSTISYRQVTANNGRDIASLYVVTPHQFASNVDFLVSQQRNFSTAVVVIIGLVALGISILVISWNRTLTTAVSTRTQELQSMTEELRQSNVSLEEANEQLKAHGRMQKEFINIAAHELRTPTQAILGYSELLQTESESSDEMIKAIYRNALRLQRLASDILDVTRIESQTLRLDKEKFGLDEAISTVLRDAHQENNNKIKFVYTPTDIVVEADKNRIIQVMSNLLSNAIKFTKEGTISITTEKTDGSVKVTISDTGAGIDAEMVPKLFTKFATKSQTGTGLGLFISKSIVEAHGGTISGKNNEGGKGATFSFTLPVDSNPAS